MDKKYTAEEAARAVLKKAEEMLKSSKLAKAGVHNPSHSNENDKGRSESGDAVRQAGHNKNLSSPTKRGLMNAAKDEHKKVLGEMKSMPAPNLPKSEDASIAMSEQNQTPADGVQAQGLPPADPEKVNGNPVWGTEPGCHKLSKFMGRREERKKKAAPTAAPLQKEEGK